MQQLAAPATSDPVSGQPAAPVERVKPEPNELAKTWNKRIAAGRKHWEKFHKRVKHNRSTVAGFDWTKDPKDADFYKLRANLIHGTITAILPNIYAKNPEISASSTHKGRNLKLLCKTLETVTNRYLEQADLKNRAKSSVRSALTCSFGVVKVMYQRDIREDPIIKGRIQDTQDNILAAEGLLADVQDPAQRGDIEAKRAELDQMMTSLNAKLEVTAAEGLVIDRVLTDNLIVDPGVCEFWDYKDSDWIAQVIPTKRSAAEGQYNMLLTGATGYDGGPGQTKNNDGRLASAASQDAGDQMIAILEIWDKRSNTVYTMAEGCDYWLREPYNPPKAGERWYPFFLLPFNVVDGQFVGPSMVDLTEKLQDEHNNARNGFNKHRDLCKPGWIGSSDINEKSIKRYQDSEIGEITILDLEGKPLSQVIIPRQHPAIDPAVYDTSAVRYDWEQVTGLQDAARGSTVNPKTATEASILQQSLSGRVSEFRDGVEDWLQEIARYGAQILMLELTPQQVERIMGPPVMKMTKDPTTGMMAEQPEKQYDWPELSREEVFDMVEMKIRAGTTSAPDKLEQQESWTKVLPIIKELVMTIGQMQANGFDAEPYINMLRETLARFDERLDVEQFLPKAPQMPAPPLGLPGAPAGPQLSPPVMQ